MKTLERLIEDLQELEAYYGGNVEVNVASPCEISEINKIQLQFDGTGQEMILLCGWEADPTF